MFPQLDRLIGQVDHSPELGEAKDSSDPTAQAFAAIKQAPASCTTNCTLTATDLAGGRTTSQRHEDHEYLQQGKPSNADARQKLFRFLARQIERDCVLVRLSAWRPKPWMWIKISVERVARGRPVSARKVK